MMQRRISLERGARGFEGQMENILSGNPAVLRPCRSARSFDTGGVFQKTGDAQQLFRGEGAADFEGAQAHAEGLIAAEIQAALLENPGQGICSFGLSLFDLRKDRSWARDPGKAVVRVRGCFLLQHMNDFIIFQYA